MKTQRKWKIGQQAPFIVMIARFHPVEGEGLCTSPLCRSADTFGIRPRATFLVQIGTDGRDLPAGFSDKEKGELLWEKAYREQAAGREGDHARHPLCSQCVDMFLVDALDDERKVAMLVMSATITGQDLLLFDRNLRRDMTHAAAALVDPGESLSEFREGWAAQERERR